MICGDTVCHCPGLVMLMDRVLKTDRSLGDCCGYYIVFNVDCGSAQDR